MGPLSASENLAVLRLDVGHLDDLSPREFEEVVAELLASLGWEVSLTPQTHDGGLDMLAISRNSAGFESTWGVECKLYRADRPVGVSVVRELYGVKQALGLPHAMLVTTSGVTPSAAEFAQVSDVRIADKDRLAQWIAAYEPPADLAHAVKRSFRSCFVSHSSKDRAFVDRLVAALREEGVRVWYAPDELRPGRKVQEDISEAIDSFDRLVIVLSESSIVSPWVKTEIRRARRREIDEGTRILFPISLMPFEDLKAWELFDSDSGQDLAIEIREYFIPDFSDLADPEEFRRELARLLEGLSDS